MTYNMISGVQVFVNYQNEIIRKYENTIFCSTRNYEGRLGYSVKENWT